MPPSCSRRPQHNFAHLGIDIAPPTLNLAQMMAHKDETVERQRQRRVVPVQEEQDHEPSRAPARSPAPGKVQVTPEKGEPQTIETRHIVIATGSVPATLPGIEIDEERIVTSTGALSLGAVPERLLVIGAGVIGLELGSVWARLGSKVTVVEFLDRILPGMDSEVARQFQRILAKQGVEFRLSTKVKSIDKQDDGSLTARLEPVGGRRHGDPRCRRRAGRHRPQALHRRASACSKRASSSTIAAASSSVRATAPMSRTSMPSAT